MRKALETEHKQEQPIIPVRINHTTPRWEPDKIIRVSFSLVYYYYIYTNLIKAETEGSSISFLLKKRKVMQDRLLTAGYR